MQKKITGFIICIFTISLMVMGSGPATAADKKVTVGCKNFTEQYIIGQMMKQVLEDRGFEVQLRADLTSMALRAGMESGDIDICADYTGTAWMVHLKQKYSPGLDNNQLYKMVKEKDMANGFVWLQPIWNNNTYAMAAWTDFAEKHDLNTLTDLANLYNSRDGKVGTFIDFEYSTRPDGLPALKKHYNFDIAKGSLKTGTPGASLIGLKEHKVDVAMVFGTDAAIAENDWKIFIDDKNFFPPYDLTPYVRKEVLDNYPEIKDAMHDLASSFPGGGGTATPQIVSKTQISWQGLNAEVDITKKEPSKVAYEYLVEHGLIK